MFKGEIMFRLYATEVWVGPLAAIVLVIPKFWKPVLGRVLEHRERDGSRYEAKEIALVTFMSIPSLFIAVWRVIIVKTYTASVLVLMAICVVTTLVTSLPRVLRWLKAGLANCQRLTPGCQRFFGKCKILEIKSPYSEGMWGAASASQRKGGEQQPGVDVSITAEGLGLEVVAPPVYPLSRVITFEQTTDPVRAKSLQDMRNLGKMNSDVPFPSFHGLQVLEHLEKSRTGEFTLDMVSNSSGVRFDADSKPLSPTSSIFDMSPVAKAGTPASVRSSHSSSSKPPLLSGKSHSFRSGHSSKVSPVHDGLPPRHSQFTAASGRASNHSLITDAFGQQNDAVTGGAGPVKELPQRKVSEGKVVWA